jgi:hypothetical protein
MPRYDVYGAVTGTKYLGEYTAKNKAEAKEMALRDASVSLCFQCTSECEDATVESVSAEKVEEE